MQIQELSCYPCHAISMRSDFGDTASQWVSGFATEGRGSTAAVGSWATSIVPEPGSTALLALAAAVWLRRRTLRA